jgi:hypothetical protein
MLPFDGCRRVPAARAAVKLFDFLLMPELTCSRFVTRKPSEVCVEHCVGCLPFWGIRKADASTREQVLLIAHESTRNATVTDIQVCFID